MPIQFESVLGPMLRSTLVPVVLNIFNVTNPTIEVFGIMSGPAGEASNPAGKSPRKR
jgi:hypothetical protein